MDEGLTTRKVLLAVGATIIALVVVSLIWGMVLMALDSVDDVVLLVGIIGPTALLAVILYRYLDRRQGGSPTA